MTLKQLMLDVLAAQTSALSSTEVAAIAGVPEMVARVSLSKLFKAGLIRAEVKWAFDGTRKQKRMYYFVGATK